MKFLLDENFPRAALPFLQAADHEAADIRDTELQGSDDKSVFDYAQETSACLLTTDRDFFHTIPHLYVQHYGVVVIALRKPNRAAILEKLDWFLTHVPEDRIPDRVIQLRDNNWTAYPGF